MKHGVAFRKFSRTSSHRMLMLRNLVTSLIDHEQIKTTLPKARDTARLAEKIISMGKKGDLPAYRKASAFLLRPTLTPKVFGPLAKRYSERPGGYTRIHKFGNREGDNAPHAILELVDNPRDLKFEMTARAVGWDVLAKELKNKPATVLVKEGVQGVENLVKEERVLGPEEKAVLRPTTRWNLQKVLKFRPETAIRALGKKAEDHMDGLLAKPLAVKSLREKLERDSADEQQEYFRDIKDLKLKAGETVPGGTQSALRTAQGDLGWTPGRRVRWFERRKLGVDRSLTWEQV
ncbi:mitochondrial ribosomal protein L17 [Artomyces pyxidatus]|uniref:Mitochondrial ribosomal protein L17 n=1 Tax=Artomyces pyxidatus TaxID=48021 RepID=A0ACB8TH71_9AGAM|nr:mitochondrial ribosomal protein L17 [Artomyces pyxidatus]